MPVPMAPAPVGGGGERPDPAAQAYIDSVTSGPTGSPQGNAAKEAWEDIHGVGTTADDFVAPWVTGPPNDTDNDGIPNIIDVTPTGGTQYAAAKSQLPTQQVVKNWPKRWRVFFNPPVISYASGERMNSKRRNPTSKAHEMLTDTVIGSFNDSAFARNNRLMRKGYLMPDTTYANDFQDRSSEGDPRVQLKANSVLDLSPKNPALYGFRFMYNPSSIDFGVSSSDDVNLGLLMAGKDTSMPTGYASTGSMISLSFPITRVDDMQAILQIGGAERYLLPTGGSANSVNAVNKINNVRWLYGSAGDKGVTMYDLQQIADRGTMYDIEYLLRASLGNKWKTQYRGETADIGLVFGLPLVLHLSQTMIYRVILRGISYTHKIFTPAMIPTVTNLTLTFDRLPDMIGAATS